MALPNGVDPNQPQAPRIPRNIAPQAPQPQAQPQQPQQSPGLLSTLGNAISGAGNVNNALRVPGQIANAFRNSINTDLPFKVGGDVNGAWFRGAADRTMAAGKGLISGVSNYLAPNTSWAYNPQSADPYLGAKNPGVAPTQGISVAEHPDMTSALSAGEEAAGDVAKAGKFAKAGGLLKSVFGAAGKVAAPVTLGMAAKDGFDTSTDQYAKRLRGLGVTPDTHVLGGLLTPSSSPGGTFLTDGQFWKDVGTRGIGAATDVANGFAGGLLGGAFDDKRAPAPAAQPAPAAAAPAAAAPTAAQATPAAPAVQTQANATRGLPPGIAGTPGMPEMPTQFNGQVDSKHWTGLGRTDGGTDYVSRKGNSFSGFGDSSDSSAQLKNAPDLNGAMGSFGNAKASAALGQQQQQQAQGQGNDPISGLRDKILGLSDDMLHGRVPYAQGQATLNALGGVYEHDMQRQAAMYSKQSELALRQVDEQRKNQEANRAHYKAIADGFVGEDGHTQDPAAASAFEQWGTKTLQQLNAQERKNNPNATAFSGSMSDADPGVQDRLRAMYDVHQRLQKAGFFSPGSGINTDNGAYMKYTKLDKNGNLTMTDPATGRVISSKPVSVLQYKDPGLISQWTANAIGNVPWLKQDNSALSVLGRDINGNQIQ